MSKKETGKEKIAAQKRSDILAQEKKDIYRFILSSLKIDPDRAVFMIEIYHAYINWRDAMEYAPTVLSIDGFGRMFPSGYVRNIIYNEGKVSRGLAGFKLVQ